MSSKDKVKNSKKKEKKEDTPGEEPLYDDGYTQLTTDGVRLKWYFFPTTVAKFIPYSEIKGYKRSENTLLRSKHWGMPLGNRWFGCDMQRHLRSSRPSIVEFDVGSWIKPACTPLDEGKFLRLLDERLAIAKKAQAAAELPSASASADAFNKTNKDKVSQHVQQAVQM